MPTSVAPMHDADAVPEQMPVFEQKPLTASQVEPVGQPAAHEIAPWQVCVVVALFTQLAVVVQAVPPEAIGPHGIPPLIVPLVLLTTHPMGAVPPVPTVE
jgi:hypothetical protein